jgi:hypothetical protein
MKCILLFPGWMIHRNKEDSMRLWALAFGAFLALGDWLIVGQIVGNGPDVDLGDVSSMEDPFPPPHP